VAIHSLRAAPESSIDTLLATFASDDLPIHIHIAEQMQEVHDCLKATGKRPIQWLCDRHAPDARWQLVHATHAQSNEIDAVARSGAGIVLCPSTEGNLGDGFPDLPAWLQAGVPMAIGSDSHVSRQWPEELRWLEYGQRALLQRRNVAANPSLYHGSTAASLLQSALSAGGQAAGHALWGLQTGARADALVVDVHAPGMLGIPTDQTLDALVFAAGGLAFKDVYVAGQKVISEGSHAAQTCIAERFATTMDALWGD
jgi:formimidoylglutamate deiminase